MDQQCATLTEQLEKEKGQARELEAELSSSRAQDETKSSDNLQKTIKMSEQIVGLKKSVSDLERELKVAKKSAAEARSKAEQVQGELTSASKSQEEELSRLRTAETKLQAERQDERAVHEKELEERDALRIQVGELQSSAEVLRAESDSARCESEAARQAQQAKIVELEAEIERCGDELELARSRLQQMEDRLQLEDRLSAPASHGGQAAAQQGAQQGVQQGAQQGAQQGVQQGVQQGAQQGAQQGVHQGAQQGVHQGVHQGALPFLLSGVLSGAEPPIRSANFKAPILHSSRRRSTGSSSKLTKLAATFAPVETVQEPIERTQEHVPSEEPAWIAEAEAALQISSGTNIADHDDGTRSAADFEHVYDAADEPDGRPGLEPQPEPEPTHREPSEKRRTALQKRPCTAGSADDKSQKRKGSGSGVLKATKPAPMKPARKPKQTFDIFDF